ncbi:MAG: YdeI/OmpD-associated family protein [Sedimentisphaerales bacterium]|nr:YdeI/OmpD-associated family protein [Sedimentisphaerales bacterium]
MKQVYVKTRQQWREWLSRHHEENDGIWLVFYRKDVGKPTLEYDAAVEEALCFGWIDSILKKTDDERYVRKFTPRKPGSRWSALNKRRVERLIAQGLMTPSGLARVNQAKESGAWDRPDIPSTVPPEFARALAASAKAGAFFDRLAPSHRRQYMGWIATAKRPDTRDRRVKEAIALLERGEKLGMK